MSCKIPFCWSKLLTEQTEIKYVGVKCFLLSRKRMFLSLISISKYIHLWWYVIFVCVTRIMFRKKQTSVWEKVCWNMAIVNGQILSADLLVIGHTSDRVTSEFLRGLGMYLKNEKLHRNEDRAFNGLHRELLASVSFYSPFSVSFYYISFLIILFRWLLALSI